MNKHPVEILALPNGAKLIFTPCPGTKSVSLEASIKQLKQHGTSMLLTLMFDEEMAANNALSLADICYQHQIDWLQLPIIDDEAPSTAFESQWAKHKSVILHALKNKSVVAVHCKGGTGRTGTVIALLLLELGWPVKKIVKEVQKVRPKALRINTQLDYLNRQLVNSSSLF
ncbi:MAG: tyrosine-protein phosphatase [Colwellia sp.]|nr:tyrosine-protein phosphatase [Colwellia sp.]MCW9081375.1 tyrosine-protein phosphatase [Colwellia sp.]